MKLQAVEQKIIEPYLAGCSSKTLKKGYRTPFYFLIITVTSLFLAEILIMIFINLIMPPLPLLLEAIFDSLILTTVGFSILYISLFRPMILHITERKNAEETARLAYAELNQVFQTAADGMRIIDKNYRILKVNETFVGLSGINKEEAEGEKCYEVFPGPQCHTLRCSLKRVLSGEERIEYEAIKKRADGTKVPCIVTATPFRRTNGTMVGIVEDFRDITEIKRTEETLQKHREHLEELVEERTQELRKTQQDLIIAEKHIGIGRLAAGVAHEIKNQIAPILTEAQRIIGRIEEGKEVSSQYILERAHIIEEASRSANKITMALLDYAREGTIEVSRYNLKDSIEVVLALFRSDFKRSNVHVTLKDLEVEEIFADKRQIEQVLINMISNAYESILKKSNGGEITISIKRQNIYVIIEIHDSGIGIPAEFQDKIFDPFFTTRSPAGTGLGLSVSYGIIERHSGRIEFKSDVNIGTTFWIYLPMREDKTRVISF